MTRLCRLLTAVLIGGAVPLMATVISVQPTASNPQLGQTLSLDVVISGAVDLYAYQIDIGFDSSILSAGSVSEGPFLAAGGGTTFFPGLIDNVGGSVSFIADSLTGAVPGVSGGGRLITIGFSAIGLGVSPVDVFNVTALDSFGEGILVSTAGATVTPFAGPEPASVGFVLAGTLALLVLARGGRLVRPPAR
jgi:hypothetical protein